MRMEVLALIHSGDIWIAEDESQEDEANKIVGLAGWYGPGKMFMDTEEQREAAGVGPFLGMLPKDYAEWFTGYVSDYLPREYQFSTTWLGETTEADHWYLLALAVLPAYQGKGIGQSLLRPRADLALSEGSRVFWHAALPEMVAMYQSWGAKIKGAEVFECMGRQAVVALWILELSSTTAN
ncbi:hypothetical protein CALCODRAFT_437678 [Calocera cornea HHB12733]|uniref:N-acetyltransferase domain-containing protein n=1 Tax=Calocera cornea HHB12733 TaxID=1353952 RepID=A0A165ELH2_9BASI|nr:hypothetical protein CALCODRAFT_437678 [Calocera cornea HHB12733]